MRKINFVLALLTFVVFNANGQEYKAGIKFSPINSQYFLDDALGADDNDNFYEKNEYRYDSITIGFFAEKYFSKKSFLAKIDFNYTDFARSETMNSTSTYNNYVQISEYSQTEKQKFYNLNLGIGERVTTSKLVFSFGIYVPVTILPKGEIKRNVADYNDGIIESKTTCTGSYKSAIGYGIGSFAGVSTVLLKHLSIGADFSYQIQFLSRELKWHGETWHYGYTTSYSIIDEDIKYRNYYTSKLVPSIVIAYTFDCKKKTPENK